MKVCKVYCTYFGARRGKDSASPKDANEALTVFKANIENDMVLDCGVENMDIIVINNYCNQITKEGEEYLKELNGATTPYGKIIVYERENSGGSLAAYSYAFSKHADDFDYWFFIEDDIKMTYPRYYEMIINEFGHDDNLGFLALTLIHQEGQASAWVSGGFGAAPKEVLMKVKEKYGRLPYDDGVNLTNYARVGHSEYIFSNAFIGAGYNIRIPKNNEVLTLADNWEAFPPHVDWQQMKQFDLKNKKYLYHLGL